MSYKKQELTIVNNVEGKACTKCEVWKPLEDFHKEKYGSGGRRSNCKECNKKRIKTWQEENKEKRDKYLDDNKERFKDYYKKRYIENSEKIRQQRKDRYALDKEKENERSRNYYIQNREKANAQSLKYYHENSSRITERRRAWNKDNADVLKAQRIRRIAKKRQLPAEITLEQQRKLLELFGGCALTGVNNDIHFDHVIPIATGHGGSVISNMIPLYSELNLSKNDRNIFEWFQSNKQRFNLPQEKFDFLIAWLAKANKVSVEDYRDHVYWCHENQQSIDDDEDEVI